MILTIENIVFGLGFIALGGFVLIYWWGNTMKMGGSASAPGATLVDALVVFLGPVVLPILGLVLVAVGMGSVVGMVSVPDLFKSQPVTLSHGK